ncbi:translocation/assembly module TamB domain-containing protein [Rehaibacterium terrae]|uniref:translocation/assembly module TamB domain-containing protein n=1 Tax=Rehaibacterium terrae TaxID=1341696 RepID=UPI00391DF54A
MSRRIRHLLLAVAASLALLSAAAWWLLRSESGRDAVLTRIAAALPEGSLHWARVEGALGRRLVFHDLRWRGADGSEFDAARVELRLAPGALAARRLQVRALRIDDAALRLAVADSDDATPPRWPRALPVLDLPLAIRLDALAVTGFHLSRGDEPLLHAERLDAVAELAHGRLAIDRFELASDRGALRLHGWLDTRDDWRHTLAADWIAATDDAPATLALRSHGDLDALELALDGHAPGPLSLRLSIDDARGAAPRWRLDTDAARVEPERFGLATAAPLRIALRAEGEGADAAIDGELGIDAFAVAIAPSRLAWRDGTLALQPLSLRLQGGALDLDGEIAFDDTPRAELVAKARSLRWPGTDAAPDLRADGDLTLQGTPDAWAVTGEATLRRDDETATLRLRGAGDRERLVLDSYRLATPGGELAGDGELRWSPRLAWRTRAVLRDLDPGWLAPGWDGAIRGEIASHGEARGDDGVAAHVDAPALSGTLRGRPLQARLRADWRGDAGDGELALRLGDSRVEAGGTFGARLGLRATLAPLHLDDLLPGTGGTLRGELALHGAASMPSLRLRLDGEALRLDGQRIGSLGARGELPARGQGGELVLDLREVETAGVQIDSATLALAGSLDALRADARIDSAQAGRLDLAADLARPREGWRGRIDALRYRPPHGPALDLRAPAGFAWDGARGRLDPLCLDAGAASLCAQAAWPGEATLEGRGLPLGLLDPWLADGEIPLVAHGTVELDARWRGDGSGEARLRSQRGGLRLDPQARRDVIGYEALDVDARLARGQLVVTLDATLSEGGRLDGQLDTGLAPDSPLSADLHLALRELTWLELLSTEIAAPRGRLDGTLRLRGTRAAPRLSGDAQLSGFIVELPALGITLDEGEATLIAEDLDRARLDGRLRAGDGVLVAEGRLHTVDGRPRLDLALRGDDLRIADTPDLQATISPELDLQYAGEQLRVRGRVHVPRARIDLERLDTTTRPSPDVVVLDPIDPARGERLAVDTQVVVSLGENVRLIGFGLDGRLAGRLQVRDRPGQAATASGALDVGGRYRAYGRELEIVRGRLGWANTALDNPALDIRAQRRVDSVTVGLQVRGSALRPHSEIFSEPAMDSSEALSWLVLGRPLRAAGSGEAEQLGAAAFALGAGGNLLAQQVGARLGLDEVGVAESRALGGAAFTVGKYLSPRLFVSYGVSLLGTGQVLTLKYLLARGFDLRIESGTESRASINWRTER